LFGFKGVDGVATKTSSAAQTEAAPEEPEVQAEPEDAPEPESKEGGDLQKHFDELEELIQDNPLLAVGVAAGVGLLLGLLLSRR
jgi:ElaB/YqjD/DUF883 family membrane-anchored ribosome-binding protein